MSTSTSTLDLKKTLAWMTIIIIVTEWFSYFVQILLNFSNLDVDAVPIETLLFLLAFLLTPFVSLIFSIIGYFKPKGLRRVSSWAVPFVLACSIVLQWLNHAAFYQYYPVFAPDLSDFSPNTDIFGFLGDLTPHMFPLLFYGNVFVFLILLPFLFNVATDGTSRIQFTHETNTGGLIAGLYLFLRPGGIAGVPLRMAFVSLVTLAAWLLSDVFKKETKIDTPVDKGEERMILHMDADSIPKWTYGGLAFLLTYSISGPAIMMNGFLYNSWVWAFLVISTLITELMIFKKIQIRNHLPGFIVSIALIITNILLIWASINAFLIRINPFLEGINLFLLGLLLPTMQPIFSKKRQNRYLTLPIRQLGFFLVASIVILFPFLTVLYTPITTWIGVFIYSIWCGLGILAIIIGRNKVKARKLKKKE